MPVAKSATSLAPVDIRKVWDMLSPAQRRGAFTLMVWMILGMVLEALGVGLIVPALALMTQQDPASHYPWMERFVLWLDNPSQTRLVQIAMVTFVAIYLLKNLFLGFLAWRQTRFTYGIQVAFSEKLFAVYLRQPYTFHLQRNSAQLIRNVNGEVTLFMQVIMAGLMIVAELLVMLGIAVLLLLIEPRGTLIVVVVLVGAAGLFYRITRRYIAQWGVARLHHDRLRLKHLQQGLGGVKDVKLLGRERDFLEQFGIHNVGSARVNRLQATVQQLPRLWLEMLGVVGLATLVLAMLAAGQSLASIVPTVGLFVVAAFRLMPSVNRVLAAMQTLRYSGPVVKTLHTEFGLEANALDSVVEQGLLQFERELRVDGVSYAYPGAEQASLKRVDLHISKGELVGLIGASGSGKSTLIDLVLGLLAPDSGQITADGVDIHAKLRAWQNQIGYVPQSIYLTDDTLRRNVAFGLPKEEIDDVAVKQAIRAAQLEEFVDSLADGLDTVVGERGVRLSGGQRQRIGIARALYHDPAILVLDEATSSLDSATEREVMRAVQQMRGNKTVLISAHRLTTVEACDHLYRLEHGCVTAHGTPEGVLGALRSA
ncbi:MAG: ATP-binding cassette domain-containing protein [Burkholderiales bacterium]|nr:ATP-binding cassette domain-containing protein [Burkholderiales bacterium]